MNRRIFTLLAGYVFVAGAFAQSLNRKEQKSAERIKNDITYLASDRLEGRATGSHGELMSAEYIASEFRKSKLRKVNGAESYYQDFNIVSLRMAKDSCEFMFNGIPYVLFKDFYPLSLSANKKTVDGLMLSAGFGITAPELNYDDYSGKDVKGKVVLINMGTPDTQQAHSKFLSYLSLESRVKQAVNKGATGVIFIHSGDSKDDPSGELSKTIKPSTIPVLFFKNASLILVPGMELPVHIKADILSISETAHNVVGFRNNHAKYTVIIGAHHDHLGRGEIKGSRSPESNDVHNGADDNASGTAGLMELSRLMKKRTFKKFNYIYIAFSGEEMGLLGSKYFVENPMIDLGNVSFMINMDMIGRLNQTLIINGTGTSPFWNEALAELKKDTLFIHKYKTSESGIGASDHTSFYLSGIPSLHFFTGQHEDYHKPSDDVGTINFNGEVKVLEKIEDLIRMAPNGEKLAYTKTKDEDMKTSFKVTLGIMPDYAFDGEGVRVDGVKDGKPASLAGLKKGDIIIGLGGEKVSNIEVYMKILTKLEKGQKTEVIYVREGVTSTA